MTDITSNRPLSPHLSIYKPQITSVLSILHRITGFCLYFGMLALALWVVLNVYGYGEWINQCLYSFYGKILMFLWSLALYYHLCNGIRHLYWDMGKGFALSAVTRSGVLVLLATVGLTGLTWWVALS